MKDIPLLKVGRHFRCRENKIIVGRNEKENRELLKLKGDAGGRSIIESHPEDVRVVRVKSVGVVKDLDTWQDYENQLRVYNEEWRVRKNRGEKKRTKKGLG